MLTEEKEHISAYSVIPFMSSSKPCKLNSTHMQHIVKENEKGKHTFQGEKHRYETNNGVQGDSGLLFLRVDFQTLDTYTCV